MTWTLVLVLVVEGVSPVGRTLAPSVAMTTVHGFSEERACRDAGWLAVKEIGTKVTFSCLPVK